MSSCDDAPDAATQLTSMAELANAIRATLKQPSASAIDAHVRAYLNETYPDLASLEGASKATGRTLAEDEAYWRSQADEAAAQVAETEAELPGAIEEARAKLRTVLDRAQELTLERYTLSDDVARLLSQLDSSAPSPDDDDDDDGGDGGRKHREATLLERLEAIHASIARSRAALAWASVLDRVLKQRDTTLDPANHTPSALAAMPHFRVLASTVKDMEATLPPGMALLRVIRGVRDSTWSDLKGVMADALVKASEPLKWPLRVDYSSVPAPQRRAFERAFTEMLYFQAEGERLGMIPPSATAEVPWAVGDGLYPLQALVRPISLRFKYHFQGKRNTNRIDKPEWAFSNIQDQVYEHTAFIADYLQPLVASVGYGSVDVKSEFTMLLFPILLDFLRTRMPHLVQHPALLAHTVYQTVLFDDAVREGGFDLSRTSVYRGAEVEWEGLAGVILREQDWFEQWLAGERNFAETQLNQIISSPSAWKISDARDEDDNDDDDGSAPTTESARQVRSLIEQITDRYSPLPALEYRAAFLRTVQLPLLGAYHQRVAGSLDAFETLSSAFVRAVPGALAQRVPDSRLTGTAGLERLLQAYVSADYILAALRTWADDVLFAEMSADMALDIENPPSVWDQTAGRYMALRGRAEDMAVRLVASEVEGELKQHLTRRWDVGLDPNDPDGGGQQADASLVAALTSFTALLGLTTTALPRATCARIYRRVAAHLANHMVQREVFAGWSKYTAAGGRALAAEVADWRAAAHAALPHVRTDPAWARLTEMATVLSLPTEADAKADAPTFAQAMAAAWGGPSAFESLRERAGLHELDQDDLQAVLRRRIECWR